MELKFSSADFTFPLLKHENVLKLINLMEYSGVDIGLFENRSHLQPSDQYSDLEKNAKKLLKNLQENDLEAADIFLQCDTDFAKYAINHPEKERRDLPRDWYLKTLEYTGILSGKHVSILPGVAFSDDYETDFNLAAEELAWRVEKAEKYGITLGIEAHVGSIVEKPDQAEELVRSVDGLTLTLDYSHFVRLGVPEKAYSKLMPYASHFHARNAAPGQLQTIAQENTIDYEKVVKDMIETGYTGYVGIEFVWEEWENNNRVDTISESILLRRKITEYWDKYSS